MYNEETHLHPTQPLKKIILPYPARFTYASLLCLVQGCVNGWCLHDCDLVNLGKQKQSLILMATERQ